MIEIATQDFLDELRERKYLFWLKVERMTMGFLKAKQPVYLWNGGWYDD